MYNDFFLKKTEENSAMASVVEQEIASRENASELIGHVNLITTALVGACVDNLDDLADASGYGASSRLLAPSINVVSSVGTEVLEIFIEDDWDVSRLAKALVDAAASYGAGLAIGSMGFGACY
jgi:hypothetical protein